MADLQYSVEYVFGKFLPSEEGAFIHLRVDLPSYQDRATKEQYYTGVSAAKVEDEAVPTNGGSTVQTFSLANTVVYAATLTGYVVQDGSNIQTFVSDGAGNITLTDIGSPSEKPSSASFNVITGRMTLNFGSTPAGTYSLLVSYEYGSGSGTADATITHTTFLNGLYNIPGVVEVALQAYRVYVLKSIVYTWEEVLTPLIEYLRIAFDQDTATAMDGSGFVLGNEGQRRSTNQIADS